MTVQDRTSSREPTRFDRKPRISANASSSLPIVRPEPGKWTQPIRTQARSATILPNFVGLKFQIHNGKVYHEVTITEAMVGHKLGEFSPYVPPDYHTDWHANDPQDQETLCLDEATVRAGLPAKKRPEAACIRTLYGSKMSRGIEHRARRENPRSLDTVMSFALHALRVTARTATASEEENSANAVSSPPQRP